MYFIYQLKQKKNIYHYVLKLLMLSIFITSLYESTQQVYKNEKKPEQIIFIIIDVLCLTFL